MSWKLIEMNWVDYKIKVHQHWPLLDSFDLDRVNGDRELLIKTIIKRYGMSEELANEEILVWQNSQFNKSDSIESVLRNLLQNR